MNLSQGLFVVCFAELRDHRAPEQTNCELVCKRFQIG